MSSEEVSRCQGGCQRKEGVTGGDVQVSSEGGCQAKESVRLGRVKYLK